MKTTDQTIRVSIEKLVHGGDGLARRDDGRVILVPRTAPGDSVEVRVVSSRRGVLRGELVRVIRGGDDRVEPQCPVFGVCGGCDWQHLSDEAQRRIKAEILAENLKRLGGIERDAASIRVVAGASYGYRTRVRLHRSAEGVGFRRRRSEEIVPITNCPVATPKINAAIADAARRSRGVAVHGSAPDGAAPHDGASHDGAAHGSAPDGAAPHDGAASDVAPSGATAVTIVDVASLDDVARSDRDKTATIHFEEVPFTFGVSGFSQSNFSLLPELADTLHGVVSGRSIIDLYAGAALLPFLIAVRRGTPDPFDTVTCVEPDSNSIVFARSNVERVAPTATVNVVHASAEAAVGKLPSVSEGTTILIDPPRGGLSRSVREWLRGVARYRPEIVYLSCDAAALARDVAALSPAYRAGDAVILDFFPQTAHIETLIRLEARS